MALTPTTLQFYSNWASSCCARVRIAARLKQIRLIEHQVKYAARNSGEGNYSHFYLQLNPNGTVPTLIAQYSNGQALTIKQSLSMLEFLDETYATSPRLLPPITDMYARTKARDLAALVACDIQPILQRRIYGRMKVAGVDPVRAAARIVGIGLRTYDSIAKSTAGKFSVGDEISIADICLYPMVQYARKYKVQHETMERETISKIVKNLECIDAFRECSIQWPEPKTADLEIKNEQC